MHMKKKLRQIKVDGHDYLWTGRYIDPNHVRIKIWKAGVKHPVWIDVTYRFDDPWLCTGQKHNSPMKALLLLGLS